MKEERLSSNSKAVGAPTLDGFALSPTRAAFLGRHRAGVEQAVK
jgi:hypothetical protein